MTAIGAVAFGAQMVCILLFLRTWTLRGLCPGCGLAPAPVGLREASVHFVVGEGRWVWGGRAGEWPEGKAARAASVSSIILAVWRRLHRAWALPATVWGWRPPGAGGWDPPNPRPLEAQCRPLGPEVPLDEPFIC